MFHQLIKSKFVSSVDRVVSNISQISFHPEKDFSRHKKLPPDKLISFLVSEGSSSTKIELLDFFGLDGLAPTDSAYLSIIKMNLKRFVQSLIGMKFFQIQKISILETEDIALITTWLML